MKKLRIIIAFVLVFSATLLSKDVFALADNTLISVGTGTDKITITTQTKADDLANSKPGYLKLKSPSAFGGYAYTFYKGDNYEDYLYLETTADGTIASFGSVDPTYRTNTYSYGDKYNYRENGVLHGCLINVGGYIKGGIYYNGPNIFGGNYRQTVNTFVENYQRDENTYLRTLVEHSVMMFNALSGNLGNKTNLVFNEDFFYINQQFKENGSSMREYFEQMDKSNYYHGIKVRENIDFTNSIYYILNPAIIASLCTYSLNTNFGEQNIAIFDYDQTTKLVTAATVAPTAFDRHDPIELTDEEKIKLSAGKQEYKLAIDDLYKENAMFNIEPKTTVASNLVAGDLKASKKKGIVEYVNAIRLAAGLTRYEQDNKAFEVSQHIATLSSYRAVQLKLPIQHAPPKPDGVSDAFYNKALAMNEGYSENIGYSQTEISPAVMMYHINMFIDDSNERPQNYSHRVKILDTKNTKFGYGISNYTYATEIKGNNLSTNPLNCWPAKGVTFMESLVYKRFAWTTQFVRRYQIQDNTNVTVKCLNTNRTWTFTTKEETTTRRFERVTNAIGSLNNKVVFFDYDIVPEAGYVYEIKLDNVYDSDENRVITYTYRTAFEYADDKNNPTTLKDLKIVPPSNSPVVTGEKYVYYVPIGEAVNFDVLLDASVVDKKISWFSSNPDIVSVTQNGLVTANCDYNEDITITVSYDGSDITDQVLVRPYNKLEQVQLEAVVHNFSTIKKGQYEDVYIKYIPDNATEQTSIKWKVISDVNPNKEYDITDPEITQYIRVDILSADQKTVRINVIDSHDKSNSYKLRCRVQGLLYEYTGTYSFKVYVALDEIRISKSFICKSSTYSAEDQITKIEIDYNDFIRRYPDGVFKLDLDYYPTNTTVERDAIWTVSDKNILDEYGTKNNGEYKIVGDKTVTVTATHGLNVEDDTSNGSKGDSAIHTATAQITIKADLQSFTIASEDDLVALREDGEGGFVGTYKIEAKKEPAVNSELVTYRSSNPEIATVSQDGRVTFHNTGTVTITARCGSYESSKVLTGIMPISDLKYVTEGVVQLRNGEVYVPHLTISPASAEALLRSKIKYTSTDSSIASVDQNGNITARSPGVCFINATIASEYATAEKISSFIEIEVIEPVQDIYLNKDIFELDTEKTNKDDTITYRISPNNYSENVDIEWINQSPDLLTFLPKSGKIIPLNSGVGKIKFIATISNSVNSRTIEKSITVYIYKNGKLAYLKGDMDKNKVINGNDASIVLDKYNKNNATAEEILIGDMDGNGVLNGTDAALILDIYNNGK